jgi:N-acetylneuraminate synthase
MSVYMVAELGINHNGDPAILSRMIDAAARAGVHAIKFQVGYPEDYVTPEQRDTQKETPWGPMTYVAYRQRLELSNDQILAAAAHARAKDMEVVVSPLDVRTVARLEYIGLAPDAYKIASPKIVDVGLLHAVRYAGRPVMLSTGMCTLEEVDQAIAYLERPSGDVRVAVLHCTSKYPCPLADLNLSLIPVLIARYPQRTIGYSGHETAPWPSEVAAVLGAQIIERHLTLDRAMWGSDQAASLEPEAFASLAAHIRDHPLVYGDGIKRLDPTLPNWRKFRSSSSTFVTTNAAETTE